MLEIRSPGALATIQDLGRRGYAHLGVGRCGAADRGALRLANRLVGNPADAAAIEITLGGLTFIARDAVTVALTGASCPGSLDWGVAVSIPALATVAVGVPRIGLRSYLAVRGGIDVPPVLGSRSTDLLGGLGPAPLAAGDLVRIGSASEADVSGVGVAAAEPRSRIRVVVGPRADWFDVTSLDALVGSSWQVAADSNRIGIRLAGPALVRTRAGELPTEPTLPGAIQVPPDGQPILLGPDAPSTGGYPVIAVVADADIDATGQLRPGDQVRFSGVDVDQLGG